MAIGVDSHKKTLAAAVVDAVGVVLDVVEFANTCNGHKALLAWAQAHGENRRFGIECSGTYGAGLARSLLEADEDVFEVPPTLATREARRIPSRGKSDPTDAIAIARVTARGDGLAAAGRVQAVDDLRVMRERRDQLVKERTRVANRIHGHLVVLCPGYERTVGDLLTKRGQDDVKLLIRAQRSARADVIRELLSELKTLTAKIERADAAVNAALAATETQLMGLAGIGPVTAAILLGEIGDISKVRSPAALAMLAGVAPLPASSGNTRRHRINRGGNRTLNFALHMIVINRCRCDPETRRYVQRRLREGKAKGDIIRCLKRHVCNRIHRALVQELAFKEAS